MFKKNTLVAWITNRNAFMGIVIEEGENRSVVEVTSAAKRTKDIGRKFSVSNSNLGDIGSGKTEVARI